MVDNELLNAIENLFDKKFDEKLKPIEKRLDNLESNVNALRTGQIETRKEIKEVSIKVSQTYDIALDAWGQSTENRELINNF